MPMSTFIINNIFFSSCSHTPPSDYGVADIIGNIGQYILIYGLGTFADVEDVVVAPYIITVSMSTTTNLLSLPKAATLTILLQPPTWSPDIRI